MPETRLSLVKTPATCCKAPTIPKAQGRQQSRLLPYAAGDFHRNTLDVNAPPCPFTAHARGSPLQKAQTIQRHCAGTALNPHHVCSKKNRRGEADRIKQVASFPFPSESFLLAGRKVVTLDGTEVQSQGDDGAHLGAGEDYVNRCHT